MEACCGRYMCCRYLRLSEITDWISGKLMQINKVDKSNKATKDDIFTTQIRNLCGESYNKGAKEACKSLIDAFREIALSDGPEPRTFTARQVIEILKAFKKGAPVPASESAIIQP